MAGSEQGIVVEDMKMQLTDMRCLICDYVLETDSTLYIRDGWCIGCECCVSIDFPDGEDDEEDDEENDDDEDEEERYADYCDMLNETEKEERVVGI